MSNPSPIDPATIYRFLDRRKKQWQTFSLASKTDRPTHLAEFYLLFVPARVTLAETVALQAGEVDVLKRLVG
ncbi:hypothetical protein CMK12_11585 [Candidatus Poribacteria bacterium]|nr:hypothetical protein [Candidatus Poribacteria bacterium]MDP6598610.1 hypothetical protein [Candidatus Poribacteria bacterium]MDP6749195.1 hypothetical protein [Candidatus Poribacteria bacterium]MDP6996758.1 hypothetical protein [Candidatus Poribacteria bacterium]